MVMLTMSSDHEKQTKKPKKKPKNKNASKKSKVVDLTISLYNLNKI